MDGSPRFCSANTSIVADSFPRCGNTFLYILLRETQNENMHIAHHMHSSGHLAMALKMNVPAVTIVRQPRDACISYMIREPNLSAYETLMEYWFFHYALSNLNGIFIIPFHQLIQDPDKALYNISTRYPAIRYVKVDDDLLERVAALVKRSDKLDRERRGDERSAEYTAGQPNELRNAIKKRLNLNIDKRKRLLKMCEGIYQKVLHQNCLD